MASTGMAEVGCMLLKRGSAAVHRTSFVTIKCMGKSKSDLDYRKTEL